ncbi:MAG: NUDIX hydrolase [Burkholderiales bacterium]
MIWKPNVTVAAVIEQDGKFLLVEEQVDGGVVLNQPAGHWEQHETLLEGVIRETREETAYTFSPRWLIGVYHWYNPRKDIAYLRFAFAGSVTAHDPAQALDHGILRAAWFTLDDVQSNPQRLRSPMVLRCIGDYAAGRRFPLEFVTHLN